MIGNLDSGMLDKKRAFQKQKCSLCQTRLKCVLSYNFQTFSFESPNEMDNWLQSLRTVIFGRKDNTDATFGKFSLQLKFIIFIGMCIREVVMEAFAMS